MSLFELHRIDTKPEWENIQPRKYNYWQRIAARTHSIITPGNAISVVGALISIIGLVLLAADPSWAALVLVIIGRLADIADGWAAHRTGTKSPLGELLDATIDKIIIFIAFVSLLISDLVPPAVLILLIAQNLTNSALSIIALKHGKRLHPSKEGKYSMALGWALLVSFICYELSNTPSELLPVLYALSAAYAVLAVQATLGYLKQFIELFRK